MAQFDVYNLRGDPSQLVINIQSDLLEATASRVVVPLKSRSEYGGPITRLMPEIDVLGARYVVSTLEIVGVDDAELGDVVSSLGEQEAEVRAALDFMMNGF